ncbi:MAG: imidazole glycerol phosphate synthase subunit HisF [Planctomycetaceae bacterium]|jgi:cyclase|nr:imidazole glycerol phosphate synthase subunit HisF [Planctomycetaceae bacterium]MDP7277453.1 AglZ/HisF2 family acetamidino modification protein [Planctomycetaceae bacterium]
MSHVRVIPALLLTDRGIVKTVRFDEETYIGCPINAVRVFNANDVDELILLDIQATGQGRRPDPERIREIADESLMPITVGGGLRDIEAVREMLACGADKIVLNSAAIEIPDLVSQCAGRFGSQCIVVSIDARRDGDRWEVFTRRGTTATGRSPRELAVEMQEQGAGEILINSIDRDGTWDGYDLELVESVATAVGVPVIACGGAGSVEDLGRAVAEGAASAVAAGSLFLFHGRRRGILITFPTREELSRVLGPENVRARL